MKPTKDEVVLYLDVKVHTKDYKGRKIKRGGAEKHIETLLCDVFRLYVDKFTRGNTRILIDKNTARAEAI